MGLFESCEYKDFVVSVWWALSEMENICILCKQHVDKVDIIGSFGCQQLPAYFLIKFDIIFDALFPLLLLLAFFFFFSPNNFGNTKQQGYNVHFVPIFLVDVLFSCLKFKNVLFSLLLSFTEKMKLYFNDEKNISTKKREKTWELTIELIIEQCWVIIHLHYIIVVNRHMHYINMHDMFVSY